MVNSVYQKERTFGKIEIGIEAAQDMRHPLFKCEPIPQLDIDSIQRALIVKAKLSFC